MSGQYELKAVESNAGIETRYRDELLAFFNSGVFLFDNQFKNPSELQQALIEHYGNDKLKKMTQRLFKTISDYHKAVFDVQIEHIGDRIPAEKTPVEKAPIEKTPAEKTPAEKTPAEKIPAEKIPAEKAPVEKAPIEKIPVERISETGDKKEKPEVEESKDYHAYTEKLQFFNYIVTKNLRDDFIYGIMLAALMQELFNTPKLIENQIISEAVDKIKQRIEIISSDQAIKITQGLTMAKCKALGLNTYKWQTKEDDRVRPTHAENNQKIFDWDNPPPQTGHPGTEINCRCKPVIIVNNTRVGAIADLIDTM